MAIQQADGSQEKAGDNPPEDGQETYVLHLYITGATPNSSRAVRNLKEICERYLPGRHELLIVDIYQQPELASRDQIIAAPTLLKKSPQPLRRLVGDLSNRDRVLSVLGLEQS